MTNRREVLKTIGLMLGGAISAPTLLAMQRAETPVPGQILSEKLTLSPAQQSIVAEVAELILPATDTPGAKDAGVPAFVVMMVEDCYRMPEHVSFTEGLRQLEARNFLSLDEAGRKSVLAQMEQESVQLMKEYNVQQTKMGDNEDREQMDRVAKGLPYWRLMKELTLLGYFTSEAGLKANFDYVPIPGKLEEVSLKPGQKSYAY